MTVLQWNPKLAVGVEYIDNQHKELFKRINDLLEAMSQGKGKQEVGNTLKFLNEYTISHFAEEEKLMIEHSYPGFNDQKAEHIKFINDLANIKRDFDNGGASLSLMIDLQHRAVNWLSNHVSEMDKEIGRFLKTKGE